MLTGSLGGRNACPHKSSSLKAREGSRDDSSAAMANVPYVLSFSELRHMKKSRQVMCERLFCFGGYSPEVVSAVDGTSSEVFSSVLARAESS